FYVFFCFFFSSRRRHTRSTRDWSSDVCSSDLEVVGGDAAAVFHLRPAGAAHVVDALPVDDVLDAELRGVGDAPVRHLGAVRLPRSEERRVGKECGARVSTWYCEKKVKVRIGSR